jgi:hypothetical protein
MIAPPAALSIDFLAALNHAAFRLHRFWEQMLLVDASSMLFDQKTKLAFATSAGKALMDPCPVRYW